MSVLGIHPKHLCARGPDYQLVKSYRQKSAGAGDEWGEIGKPWISPHSVREAWLDSLGDFVELLDWLKGSSTHSIVLGRLAQSERNEPYVGTWLVPDRTKVRYDDCPTRWFPVDLDALPGDAIDAPDAIKDYISESLPELEGCAYVAVHTGSSGIKGARVRLWFELAEARHLAAFAAYAKGVNARARSNVIDASIYTPSHLVLTAEPELRDAGGKPIRRPVPSNAWYVAGDRVPADAFPDVVPGANAAAYGDPSLTPRTERVSKLETSALLAAMGPGNYNVSIHSYLCSQAWRSQDHREQAEFEDAAAVIFERIKQTSEPDQLAERLRQHANPKALRQKWLAARERRRKASDQELIGSARVPASVMPVPTHTISIGSLRISTAGFTGDLSIYTGDYLYEHGLWPDNVESYPTDDATASDVIMSIADARVDLSDKMRRVVEGVLIKHEKGHWLFTHAPGCGKTQAIIGALVTPGVLSSNLVRISVPDHRLAAELVERCKDAARGLNASPAIYGDLVASIRHHQGRRQPGMCPDDESRPKADRVEALGASPRKSVCHKCATGKAGRCPWINQEADDRPGVIVEVHASASSHKAARRTDLRVVDEGILSSVIQAWDNHVDLASLGDVGSIRNAPNAAGSLGATLHTPSLKLNGYRRDLIKGLRAAIPSKEGSTGKASVNLFTAFNDPAMFKARVGLRWEARNGIALDEAIELETQLQTSLVQQILHAEEMQKPTSTFLAQLRASQNAARIYDAIGASLRCERVYVFGLAIFWQKMKGKRHACIKLATRAAESSHIFGEASITLDGTAEEAVWRALVAPTGAGFTSEVFGASPAYPSDALHAVQYIDKAGAKSSLRAPVELTEAERDNITRRDALVNAPRWAREHAFAPGQYEIDAAVAASAVAQDTQRRADRKLRADSNIGIVHSFVCFKAAETCSRAVEIEGKPVSVLVVAQKAVKDHLIALGLPDNVAAEHFGKLRGIDRYKDVPVVIVVGRSRPANIDLELLTEALHMHAPAVKSVERYDVDPKAGRRWGEAHPDPLVRAVQLQITGADVKQAVARARLFDRTPATSCEVHVFGVYDTGLPESLMQRKGWSDAARSPVEIALARGVVFEDMRLNQIAYGQLFPRGAKDGRGRSDREGKLRFSQLVEAWAAAFGESGLNPNKVSREGADLGSLLGLETGFGVGQRHKLVKLRTPASRKASFALARADITEADLAQLLGMEVISWIEQSADQVVALGRGHLPSPPDALVCAAGVHRAANAGEAPGRPADDFKLAAQLDERPSIYAAADDGSSLAADDRSAIASAHI